VTDVLLLRAGLAPSFILLRAKADYYNGLGWCDSGDGRPFASWLAHTIHNSLKLYADASSATSI
jgi:hypothetical protein